MWRDLTEKKHWYGEIWNRRKNGEDFPEALTITAVCNASGVTEHYVALFSDITAIKAHQKQLEHLAHFDALTSLPNRVLLLDRLHQSLTQAQRRGSALGLVYLDLDGFKAVNDQHGHETGDQLLIALAARMKQTLREGDTLARIGGDEFVAVLPDLAGTEASAPLLNRLLNAAAQPVHVGELKLEISASIGVTFYPQLQAIEADQLLRQADQAMYQAKLSGKHRYHVFDAQHDSSIRVHHETLERMRLAVSRGEFILHYQPKVNMRSNQVIGAEALIRWRHPERGLLGPNQFLPVIENDPLAVVIGEWVIDSALTQVQAWRPEGLEIAVSVNVAARQLQQIDFVSRLHQILLAHPELSPSCLELEILETSALEDVAQLSGLIESCAKLGVRFALDDFGTGYSSLTHLKRLRAAMLKIDQSFVRDMLSDPDDMAILQGVIGLAAAFKCEVIAEGVESLEQSAALLQMGCDLAQGYGIAPPMPGAALPAWVSAWQAQPKWGQAR
jgi:diguanylate cyclase (GGDEF)-like protein